MTSFLPQSGGDAPVSMLEAARSGLVRRGNRIHSVLSGLMVLQLLLVVVLLGGAAVGWAFLRDFTGTELPGVGEVPQLGTLLRISGASLLLGLVTLVLYVFSILAARRAIRGVQRYAAAPGQDQPPVDVQPFTRWLTFWQWYTVIASLASLALIPLIVNLSSSLDTAEDQLDSGGQAFVTIFTVVGSLLQLIPTVVLGWLILGAIKRFFRAVELHHGGARTPVQPVASTAGNWLIFVMVLLGLGLGALLLNGALLLVLAAVPGMANLSGNRSPDAFAEYLPAVFIGLGVFTLVIAAVYGLLIALVAWSRGFALDVATLLGSGSGGVIPGGGFNPGGAMNSGTDAWRGAVTPPESPQR